MKCNNIFINKNNSILYLGGFKKRCNVLVLFIFVILFTIVVSISVFSFNTNLGLCGGEIITSNNSTGSSETPALTGGRIITNQVTGFTFYPGENISSQTQYCGDSICNGVETCSSCQADCGICVIPPPESPGGGGGGAAMIPIIPKPAQNCTASISCSDWTMCLENNVKSRKCIDLNNCTEKYTEMQNCTYLEIENETIIIPIENKTITPQKENKTQNITLKPLEFEKKKEIPKYILPIIIVILAFIMTVIAFMHYRKRVGKEKRSTSYVEMTISKEGKESRTLEDNKIDEKEILERMNKQ